MKPLSIQICKVTKLEIEPPCYQSELASGMDLRAAIESPITLQPQERVLVATGYAFAIPPGYEGQVRPRSGLAHKHGVSIVNTPGTIDADYRGEIKVNIINFGKEPFTIQRGDRIAQLVIVPVIQARLEIVSELDATPRGAGGHGSTGV